MEIQITNDSDNRNVVWHLNDPNCQYYQLESITGYISNQIQFQPDDSISFKLNFDKRYCNIYKITPNDNLMNFTLQELPNVNNEITLDINIKMGQTIDNNYIMYDGGYMSYAYPPDPYFYYVDQGRYIPGTQLPMTNYNHWELKTRVNNNSSDIPVIFNTNNRGISRILTNTENRDETVIPSFNTFDSIIAYLNLRLDAILYHYFIESYNGTGSSYYRLIGLTRFGYSKPINFLTTFIYCSDPQNNYSDMLVLPYIIENNRPKTIDQKNNLSDLQYVPMLLNTQNISSARDSYQVQLLSTHIGITRQYYLALAENYPDLDPSAMQNWCEIQRHPDINWWPSNIVPSQDFALTFLNNRTKSFWPFPDKDSDRIPQSTYGRISPFKPLPEPFPQYKDPRRLDTLASSILLGFFSPFSRRIYISQNINNKSLITNDSSAGVSNIVFMNNMINPGYAILMNQTSRKIKYEAPLIFTLTDEYGRPIPNEDPDHLLFNELVLTISLQYTLTKSVPQDLKTMATQNYALIAAMQLAESNRKMVDKLFEKDNDINNMKNKSITRQEQILTNKLNLLKS